MRRLLVVASGTLGDILPVVRVLKGLPREVQIDVVSNDDYKGYFGPVASFTGLPFEPASVIRSKAGQRMIEGGWLGIRRIAGLRAVVMPQIRPSMAAVRSVATPEHCMLVSGVPFGAGLVAAAIEIPVIRMLYQPHWPNDDIKSLYLNSSGEPPRSLRRHSHKLVEHVCRRLFEDEVGRGLDDLSMDRALLTAAPNNGLLHESYWLRHRTLFCVPRLFTHSVAKTADNSKIVGFIHPRYAATSARFEMIVASLSAERRPKVFIGFGSMQSSR
jgi:hypothetical protein